MIFQILDFAEFGESLFLVLSLTNTLNLEYFRYSFSFLKFVVDVLPNTTVESIGLEGVPYAVRVLDRAARDVVAGQTRSSAVHGVQWHSTS